MIVVKNKAELGLIGNGADGKILIAEQTTPHYIPYLGRVKAIITDEGGLTCHAAIVARELGVPCVTGTKIATRIINDGEIIEVDANSGRVRIIK